MICSSASTNDPAAAKVSTTQSQLCKYSSGYPEQLGNVPRSRHSGMSYGSTNGSSNGSLIQHHHHHHDYGYHHHHLGSIRSPTVSSAPDSSFVGQQQDHSHHHQQHLDSCSIHSSAVAAVAQLLMQLPQFSSFFFTLQLAATAQRFESDLKRFSEFE